MKHVMTKTRNSKFLLMLMAALILGTSLPGCKAKKEAQRLAQLEQQRTEQAKNDLKKILDDENMSVEDMEKELEYVKKLNLADPDVKKMITEVETKIGKKKKELEEAEKKRLAEEKIKKEEEVIKLTKEQQLDKYMDDILAAPNADEANKVIDQALEMFTSPDALLLKIVYKKGTTVDYDKPTTINEYLHYVKDQKQHVHRVDKLILSDDGKIKEIELIKK